MHKGLLAAFAGRGDKEALVFLDVDSKEERRFSYAQLAQTILQKAGALHGQGIGEGDRVAVETGNTPDTLVTEFACGLLGASGVPLDAKRDTQERRAFKLKDTGAEVLAPSKGAALEPEERDMEEEYLVLYTSGTTAHPKGVLLSKRSCLANAEGIVEWQKFGEATRFSIVLPLHHINSTIFSLAVLLAGGTVILNSRYSASRFWEVVNRHEATHTSVVPTILHDLLSRKEEFPGTRTLERVLVGSAPVLPEQTLSFIDTFKVPVIQGYGQTETALRVTGVPVDLPQERYLELVRANSIGKALINSEVAVLREDGGETKEGEEGELCIRGSVLANGYLNDEEETRRAFRDGWYWSGDMGSFQAIDGEAYFFIKGRKKEVIIKGGVNISPAAVEDALLKEFGQIQEVCVVGYPDPRMGEEVAAAVRFRKGSSEKERAAVLNLAELPGLSEYETPRRVVETRQELPKTSTGKIQRVEVKNMLNAYTCRRIFPEDEEEIKRAVLIHNKRWNLPTSEEEVKTWAKQGYLFGVFALDTLLGTLFAVRVAGKTADTAPCWKEVVKKADEAGDTLACMSISVDGRRHAPTAGKAEAPSQERVERYVNEGEDHVLSFHESGGAKAVRVVPNGRPEDEESMGYNVVMEYPSEIQKPQRETPAALLVYCARREAEQTGCSRVVAFSRPAGLKAFLLKEES